MSTEFGPVAGQPELLYTDEERQILARVNPVFGEVHDGQQTVFAAFDGDDGQRHALEISPFYMNKADRRIDPNVRHGVWGLNEYNAAGEKVTAARMERLPVGDGLQYTFNVRDTNTGHSRPASHAEAAHLIKLLGGMADTRDRAIATGEYPLVQQRAARRRILPALVGLLRSSRSA